MPMRSYFSVASCTRLTGTIVVALALGGAACEQMGIGGSFDAEPTAAQLLEYVYGTGLLEAPDGFEIRRAMIDEEHFLIIDYIEGIPDGYVSTYTKPRIAVASRDPEQNPPKGIYHVQVLAHRSARVVFIPCVEGLQEASYRVLGTLSEGYQIDRSISLRDFSPMCEKAADLLDAQVQR